MLAIPGSKTYCKKNIYLYPDESPTECSGISKTSMTPVEKLLPGVKGLSQEHIGKLCSLDVSTLVCSAVLAFIFRASKNVVRMRPCRLVECFLSSARSIAPKFTAHEGRCSSENPFHSYRYFSVFLSEES